MRFSASCYLPCALNTGAGKDTSTVGLHGCGVRAFLCQASLHAPHRCAALHGVLGLIYHLCAGHLQGRAGPTVNILANLGSLLRHCGDDLCAGGGSLSSLSGCWQRHNAGWAARNIPQKSSIPLRRIWKWKNSNIR